MDVICLEEDAFFKLVEKTVERLSAQFNPKELKWIPEVEAMSVLNVKSKSTMQRLRDEGKIGFSQPMHKIILYDRSSLISYIENHEQKPF